MPTNSLDSLIVGPEDFDLYNGHHTLHTIEFPRPLKDARTVLVDPKATPHTVAQWLNQPGVASDNGDATLKLLLIRTRNQSTAKKAVSYSSSSFVDSKDPPLPQSFEGRRQAEFVKDIFDGLGLPLAAFGSYIKAHITFMCVPTFQSRLDKADNINHPSSTKYYCSGTS